MNDNTLVATALLTGSLVNIASPLSPTMTFPDEAPCTVIASAPVPPRITLLPPFTAMMSLPPKVGSCVVIVRIWPDVPKVALPSSPMMVLLAPPSLIVSAPIPPMTTFLPEPPNVAAPFTRGPVMESLPPMVLSVLNIVVRMPLV